GVPMVDLGTFGGDFSDAEGINDLGHVVGDADLPDGTFHAFLWTPNVRNGTTGRKVDLGTLGGDNSVAFGINEVGQVVGFAQVASGLPHAFLWTPDVPNGQTGRMVDLGVPFGDLFSRAIIPNDLGQVVGRGVGQPPDFPIHGFVWTPNVP